MDHPELAIGDLVHITRPPSLDLTNGDRMRLVSTANAVIELVSTKERDGKPECVVKLPERKPLQLEHAYSAIFCSEQGLTNDLVMIFATTKSRTTSLSIFYMSISRGRLEARIYTDAIAGLPRAIAKRNEKTMALALQKECGVQRLQKAHAPKTVVDGPKTERTLKREKRMRSNSSNGGMEHTK